MLSEFVYTFVKARYVAGAWRWLIKAAIHIPPGAFLAAVILARIGDSRRRAAIHHLAQLLDRDWPRRRLVGATRLWARISGEVEATAVHWLVVAKCSPPEQAQLVLFSEQADALVTAHQASAHLHLARAFAAYETGRHPSALANFERAMQADPTMIDSLGIGLSAAYSAGLLRRPDTAIEILARNFGFIDRFGSYGHEQAKNAFLERTLERAIEPLLARFAADQAVGRESRRYGIFFLSSTEALGHAILDPYYFLALRRENYDRVIFIGPPKASYRPASTSCLKLVERYGDYVEVSDEALLNFSWMSVGTFSFGSIDLVIEHYWSLLREAVSRTRDRADGFAHNAWQIEFPPHLVDRNARFCERHGIDLGRPLVVVHARHSSYHGLRKQAYRDTDVGNYRPAIDYLLAEGYQVVRIGDRAMPKMEIGHGAYFELPFLADYQTDLDPFLIAKAAFMIGCQSGPCAYARALGIPLLSVNAVLHYTLLPGRMEMGCFKRYFRDHDDRQTEMTLEEALDANVQHLDSSYHFEQARIQVRDAAPEEIVAAVKDMIAWLAAPDLRETEHQCRFREAVERKTQQLGQQSDTLALPIADYLGIALPGYRLSPTVAQMRAGESEAQDCMKEHA